MEPITLGVIGLGIMGRRMLDAARDHPAMRITAVWDPSPGAGSTVASADAVVAGAQAVYIASPPRTHLGHVRRALAAGRAVLCEKPLATDVADARALLAEDGARDRVAVNFPFASSAPVARLREWMAAGAVGSPASVTTSADFARWPRPWQADAAPWLDGPEEGGFTREVVSHFLFLARRLFGPLALVDAAVAAPDPARAERGMTARLRAGTVPVALSGGVGTTDADDSNLFTIAGPAGQVRLRNWSLPERLDRGAWVQSSDAIPHPADRNAGLMRQLDGLVSLHRGEPHPLATLDEAFDVQQTVEAILASRQDAETSSLYASTTRGP